MRKRIIEQWLNARVLIEVPATTWIDALVTIGEGTSIASGVHLKVTTRIGIKSVIEPYSVIEDCTLHDMVTVRSHSVLNNSILSARTIVGPFVEIYHETVMMPQRTHNQFHDVQKTTITPDINSYQL